MGEFSLKDVWVPMLDQIELSRYGGMHEAGRSCGSADIDGGGVET